MTLKSTHGFMIILLLFLGRVSAQDVASAKFEIPSDQWMWINSAPISVEAMHGKAIVLYFSNDAVLLVAMRGQVSSAVPFVQGN